MTEKEKAARREIKKESAACRYSEALKAGPHKELMARLLSNRAMAYSKGGRHADALADAEEAVRLAPTWDKPCMRQGTAFLGLQRLPEAIAAFVQAWKVGQGSSCLLLDGSCPLLQ